MDADLQKVAKQYAGTEPKNLNSKEHTKWLKGYQKAMDAVRKSYAARDGRFTTIEKAIKSVGGEKDFLNSGSAPKTPKSDVDITELKPGTAKKLINELNGKGFSIKPHPTIPGRFDDPAKKLVIWETPPNVPVKSQKWRDWVKARAGAEDTFATSGGLHKTSGGKVGAADPQGAVLDNVKKAVEAGIHRNPATEPIDSKTVGKSVSKSLDWTKTKAKSISYEFRRQAEALRKGRSWDEAGITSPSDPPDVRNKKISDWLGKAQNTLKKTYDQAVKQSKKLTQERLRQKAEGIERLREINRKHTGPDGKLTPEGRRLRNEQQRKISKIVDELRSIPQGNNETLKTITERSPEIGGKLTGQKLRTNPDGTVTDLKTGKTMTRSTAVENVTSPTRKSGVQTVKESAPTAQQPKETGPVKPAPPSKITKYGGGFLLIYQGYESIKAYSDYLDKAAKNDPENFGVLTIGKGLGLGVATFFGIPGLIELGERSGREVREQYEKDLREGKTWLLPPAFWGGAYGAWNFGRAIFVDPLIAGGEAVVEGWNLWDDYAKAWKAAEDALNVETRLKEKYKPLEDMMSHVIGGPLPPIWDKNRLKYYKIFKPLLDNPAELERIMKTPRGRDLWKWIKEYKDRRAKELGITFGRPGADNPDDNDNIGRALMALPPQDRPLYLRAVEKGDAFLQDFLTSRDRGAFPDDLGPETLGAFLQASRVAGSAGPGTTLPMLPEQQDAVREIFADLLRHVGEAPDTAVLAGGYARGVAALLGAAGEPATLVQPTDPVEILSRFRLLIIPTGALSDWSMSEPFRRTMEAYVSGGGTILAFAQQLGKEYAILPSGKESPVAGYGFAEDQSCQYASSQITAPVGAFSSMTKPTPDFNVDGFFLNYPPKSAVWLSRTKNDQPCMISYPHGKGRVVLSALYMDWAAGNHQGTQDERLFFRDLVAFLLAGDETPVFTKGDNVSLRLTLPEPDKKVGPGKDFRPLVFRPDGSPLETADVPVSSPTTAVLSLTKLDATGYYRVGGMLLDDNGEVVSRVAPSVRFAVSALPSLAAQNRADAPDVRMSLQSDLEEYIRGAVGRFTILAWNNGDVPRKVRANWRFPHNLWSAGERDKGEYQGSMLLELAPKSRASAELRIRIVNSDGIDRLWVDFVDEETKKTIVTLSKGFYSKSPQTPVTVTSDKGGYSTGERLLGEARFGNPFGAKSTGSVQFVLTDSSGRTAATTDVPFEAEAEGAVVSCDIPLGDLFSGSCVLQAFVTLRGAMSGVGELPFTYKGVALPFRGKVLDRFTGAPVANARISFYLGADRTDAVSDANGILSLSLPAAMYAIAAEADGYNSFTRTAAIRPASGDAKTDSDAFMLRLLPFGKGAGTGMVHGTIFDRVTNEVVPDMAIHFVRGTEILEIRSDATGAYSLALEPGDYTVRCVQDGIGLGDFPLRVLEGWNQTLDLYPACGKVTLRVLDQITGKPLRGASVAFRDRAGKQEWKADAATYVNRDDIFRTSPGRRQIRVALDGYHTLETETYVSERPTVCTLFLRPVKSALAVRVSDLVTGLPIEGASVSAMRPGQTPPAGSDYAGPTGKDGSCPLRLEDGRWAVVVEAKGYQKLTTETVTAVNLPTTDGAITLPLFLAADTAQAPGAVKVLVRDVLTGKPIEGVAVQSTQPSGGHTATVETDASGQGTLMIPDGRTALLFRKDRYEELATEIVTHYRNREVEEFYMTPVHTVWPVGVRVHRTGEPLEGVRVFRIEGETRRNMGVTAKDGSIRLNVPRGRQILEFVRDEYAPLRTEFCFSGTGREEALTDEVYMTETTLPYAGVVKDAKGTPISGVTVAVKQGAAMKTLVTGSDGRFSAPLAGGVFEISFSSDAYPSLTTQGYFGGVPDADEEYVLTSGDVSQGTISFRVVDALTGKPIPAFSAYLLNTAWKDGRDGAVSIAAIFRAEGYHETGSFYPTTFPGQTVVRTIRMQPSTGEMTLKVLDALTGKPIQKFSAYMLNTAWSDGTNGTISARVPAGNRQIVVRAQGYYETGSFYPTVFTGRSVTQTVFLWPVLGEMTFRVLDAMTEAPIPLFSIYFMNSNWRDGKDGSFTGSAEPGNRQTVIRAQGYIETASFYPSTHHGRSVTRTIRLWPEAGRTTFSVRDALTGEKIPRFTGYLLNSNWQEGRDGEMSAAAAPGNRQTVIRAEGYYETGSFYPTTFRGRTTEQTIFLWPSAGTMTFLARDALTGKPIDGPFDAYIQNSNWQRSEPGSEPSGAERSLSARAESGNRQSVVRADGYLETGSFYPTTVQGRNVEMPVYLHPSAPRGLIVLRAEDVVTGMPVRNAAFVPSGERPIAAPEGTATHSANAHFKHQWFQASAPGYRNVSLPGCFVTGRQGVELILPMEEELPAGTGALRVSVTDSSGTPLEGARVTLGGGGKETVASSDVTGRAFFSEVRSGIYTLSAQKSGYQSESSRTAVPGATETLRALKLKPLGEVRSRAPYTPRILSVPDDIVLRPGERQTLQVTLGNDGDAGGSSLCVFDIPGLLRSEQAIRLNARERRQIPFDVSIPEDAVSSRLSGVVTLGTQTATGSLRVEAPTFRCVAKTDREAYREGDKLALQVLVSTDSKAVGSDDLQVRVTFNDTSLVRDLKIVSGDAAATFRDIPVAFRGNKLMYGLYHRSGRSILINALPVLDGGRETLLLPDKTQYRAGETIKLRISGAAKETVTLTSGLFRQGAEGAESRTITLGDDGTGAVAIPLPGTMPTGTHEIRCGDASVDIDIRGYETKVIDRRVETDAETGSLRLLWTAATLGRIPCRWTVESVPIDETGEAEEVASGAIVLEGERAEYSVATDLDAEESRELTLTLLPEGAADGDDPVALVRYAWSAAGSAENGHATDGAAVEIPEPERNPEEIAGPDLRPEPELSTDPATEPDSGDAPATPKKQSVAAAALQKHLAAQLRNEGATLQRNGRYNEALARYRESLSVMADAELEEYAVKLETLLRKRAKRLADEGTELQRQKKYAEAVEKFRQSLAYYRTPKVEEHIRKLHLYIEALKRRQK
jgi:5-hydroxyisourate hydrolase-like protein (transthyretin family)